VTVDVGSSTHFKGATSDGSAFTLANVHVGDQLRVYSASIAVQPIVALYIGDGPSTADSHSAPTTSGDTLRFTGVVTEVRGDGLTVTASDGPLSGQSVVVAVPSSASLDGAAGSGGGAQSLANVALGDTVAVYTHSETGSPVVAVGVRDYGNPSTQQGD
jgi:hypothetical protein